jgi:hypothetical protein
MFCSIYVFLDNMHPNNQLISIEEYCRRAFEKLHLMLHQMKTFLRNATIPAEVASKFYIVEKT